MTSLDVDLVLLNKLHTHLPMYGNPDFTHLHAGYNNFGSTGQIKYTEVVGLSDSEMGNNLPTVNLGTGLSAVHITAGEYHVCVLLNNRRVKCWGLNHWYRNDIYGYTGILGNGNKLNYGAAPSGNEFGAAVVPLGDNLPYALVGSSSNPVK